MVAIPSKFGTAKAAFDSFRNKEGTISKKEWRRVVKKTLPELSQADAQALRRQPQKKVDWVLSCRGPPQALLMFATVAQA